MPFPIRHLPLIQNWDCHACGNCCTDYWVPVSDEERKRIEGQGWGDQPDFKGLKLFVKYGKWGRRKYRLNQRAGDRCIFLSDQGLCRIHEKFGIEAKPFACRLYPYILVPAGDHFRVSMRFACPSAAGNKGRPLADQLGEMQAMARELEEWDRDKRPELASGELNAPPPLQGRQRVSWPDLQLFVNALLAMLRNSREPMARRMLKCLALVRICREARFDKLTGPRLREFLDMLRVAVDDEVSPELAIIPPPGWVGRILFRSALAIYLRKDQGTRRGVSRKGRLALMAAIWRMVRGTGRLPRLQVGLPEKMFSEFEAPAGPLPPEAEQVLERYYSIKVESLQFCGKTHFNAPFWAGFEALALTLPMILWLSRGFRDLGQPEAIFRAISIVDENFGYSPLLGKSRQRLGVRILAYQQELDRLIAWYSQ